MGFVFVLCLVFFSVVADLFMSFKHIYMIYIYGEGNGNLLQYSCLENPMAGGAW